ncbi:hypothetical protein C7B62_19070 [Pleurocapsa sp. CCALA 161]|uniref:hypothetical protein n=1 Tax=Pleurocapsa sp. CCALA 161 TaxID=2107688 RepID=UPI000D048B16|nr:hypothetical protein [Pleurocapsa sp. CCALA 161]PSB07719.1 hypothetical protein C7B62_19070 [Pleurocapsa sp. CCALA 161]
MTIPVPQRINNKLTEEFYPLQREELIKLREVKLINNAAYVHLALRSENPFCDRPVQIIPKEFALRWRIPEVSVYKAIAKLKELGILNIKSGKLVIDWVIKSENQDTETDTEDVAVNDFSNPTENYQIEEKIIRSDNSLSNPKTDYQIRENCGLKPLADIGSSIPQTLQTYSDFKDSLSESERENFLNFVKEKIQNLERPINDLDAWLASKNAAKQNRWEIYYRNFQEAKINGTYKTTRHSENGAGSALEAKKLTIAKFRQKMRVDESVKKPVDEPQNLNSKEDQISPEEFNKLLDNPPEREERKSLAQQRREYIAEIKQQQEEIKRARKEAAEERVKQLNQDREQQEQEIFKQVEELKQWQQSQQSSQNSDLNEEDGSNE